MYFEEPTQCPLLENDESIWCDIPHCTMIYAELTAWTLSELCYKNFEKCPVYKKYLNRTKK